jgi:hypothetical protein
MGVYQLTVSLTRASDIESLTDPRTPTRLGRDDSCKLDGSHCELDVSDAGWR